MGSLSASLKSALWAISVPVLRKNRIDMTSNKGGTGGWEPKNNGGRRGEKRGREEGYPRGVGAGRNGKNFATLAQYFAIGKAHRGGNHYGREWEPGVQGAGGGKFRLPSPPPKQSSSTEVNANNKLECLRWKVPLGSKGVQKMLRILTP